MFITFEGSEGGGKSTQLALLADRLRSENVPVVATRQPGGEELGKKLRALLLDQSEIAIDPMAELLMMMADRAQSVRRVIRPALDSGAAVLCDRYADSSVAYQGYGRGIDLETVHRLNAIATGGLQPQITLLLDIDPEIGLQRQTHRNRMEEQEAAFHRRVRDGFLEIAKSEPERVHVIDSSRPRDEVAAEVWSIYEAYRRSHP